MAEPGEDQNAVNITSKWGGLSLVGKDAVGMFLFIAVLGLCGLTIYEHIQRSVEHDIINCMIKLNLFMQTQSMDKAIDWRKMPIDTYNCVPRFLFDRDQSSTR